MRKPTSLVELHAFVLDHIADAPLAKRALLLRTLAEVIGSADDAAQLRRMAAELDALEARHQQLLLNFRAQRREGQV